MRRCLSLSVLALCGCSRLIGLDEFEYQAGTGGTAGSGGIGGAAHGGVGASTGHGGAGAAGGSAGAGAAAGAGTGGTGTAGTGSAGTAGSGGTAPFCDTNADPEDEPCLIDEAYGVFVSADGNDASGDGTRGAPYGTINKALDEAAATHKRVYACRNRGTYTTPIHYRAEHSGVHAYGDFLCETWTFDGSLYASIVAPETPGPALVMEALTGTGTRVRGFDFYAVDASAPGESSIAGVIKNSSGVSLRSLLFDAGSGADGGSATPAPFNFPSGNSLDGADATSGGPGNAATFDACPGGGTSTGGAGGDTSPNGGDDGSPLLGGGQGGDVAQSECAAGLGGGAKGANGLNGAAGEGALVVGKLVGNGWIPQPGKPGDPGGIAQGGGGGRGSTIAAGGGGAAGGCGGAGGVGGLGGGASIALLVLDSEVGGGLLTLKMRDGGDGGTGSLGQVGMLGGSGGNGWQTPDGCPGGDGGQGGLGGPGGAGAGGISVGLAWRGTEPEFVSILIQPQGLAGDGGAAVGGGNSGVNGIRQNRMALPTD